MGKPKVKGINSLMAYLRDKHKITINGSSQKNKLRNIGYFHGYKGYRFFNNPSNRIAYSDFREIVEINDFDMKLKALFYPQIMFIETALKNYILETVLDEGSSESFNVIYTKLLTDYKSYPTNGEDYSKAIKKRLDLRNTIYGVLTREYKNNSRIVQNYYHKDESVPIWGIFELISLGEFGAFVSCLDKNIRKKVSLSLSLNQSCDPQAKLTQTIIYTIKDLRNSIAHNDVIFDTRFRKSNVGQALIRCLQFDTKVSNIGFDSIVDYLVLLVYLLKKLKVSKTEMDRLVRDFESSIENLRKKIPVSIYSKIVHTDTRNKLCTLFKFIKSN